MAVRLEIGWHPDLADAEGEAVRRQAREYFGLDLAAVRVLRVLTLDMDLPDDTLEAIRTGIFTHPTTQISSFQPLAQDFHWAIWVGFKPGVRDTAGGVALEAIAAFLGRSLPAGAAVYTSKLFLLTGENLTEAHATTLAKELLANDMVQEFRIFSRQTWDASVGVGIILPRVELAHTPTVEAFEIASAPALKELSRRRHLALREADLPVILD